MPAPLPVDETQRIAVLRAYAILDTPPDPGFDDLARIAALVAGTAMAAVAFVDRERVWTKAAHGPVPAEVPRDHGLCAHAILDPGQPLVVEDASRDARFAGSPLVTGRGGVRFYAGIPLCAPLTGMPLGTLCVIDPEPRRLSAPQLEALQALARQVNDRLEAVATARRLDMLISERRNASEALRRAEARFLATTEALPLGVLIGDGTGACTYVNRQAMAITGLTAEQLSGAGWTGAIHPEDRTAVLARVAEMVEKGVTFASEHRMLRPDGSVVWVSAKGGPMFSDGQLIGHVGLLEDISERRQVLQELEYSERRFNLVAQATSDAIWDWDLVADRLWWSDGVRTLFGYAPGDIVRIHDWAGLVHPDDRARIERDVAVVLSGTVDIWTAEYRFLRSDGTYALIFDCGRVIRDANGGAVRMVGGMRDITEHRRVEEALRVSEARFKRVVESNMLGIMFWKLDGAITDANDRLLEMIGYSRDDLRAGRIRWNDMTPPEYAPAEARALAEVAANGVCTPFEKEYIRKDGSRVPILLGGALLHRGSGEGVAFVLDISERRRLEEQLRQAQKMEAIGRLAGGVAHDFNNLLTVIKGHGELLLQRLPAGDAARKHAEPMLQAANHAADLTRQLLAFSRQSMLKMEALDLNRLVGDDSDLLRRLIGEHIDLVLRRQPGLGHVRADAGQMHQVIMNLALNARDAMPEGGTLTLATTEEELATALTTGDGSQIAPGRYVVLMVSDTGSGMDERTRLRIFEPFFTTKEQGKGTGLGLATVFGIVKQSGGHIQVESQPGRGTTFRLHLPRVEAPRPPTAPTPAPRAMDRGEGGILLVEDDAAVRALAADILADKGYRVQVAGDGAQALALLAGGGVDLLITDLVMPGMGGWELAEQATARVPGLRVIYASGYSENLEVRQRIHDRRGEFLQKPYSADQLTSLVRRVLAS